MPAGTGRIAAEPEQHTGRHWPIRMKTQQPARFPAKPSLPPPSTPWRTWRPAAQAVRRSWLGMGMGMAWMPMRALQLSPRRAAARLGRPAWWPACCMSCAGHTSPRLICFLAFSAPGFLHNLSSSTTIGLQTIHKLRLRHRQPWWSPWHMWFRFHWLLERSCKRLSVGLHRS